MKYQIAALTILMAMSAQAADNVIIQKDKKFDHKEIKVKKGDTITFKNEEKDVTHNVYSLSPANSFEMKIQPPGQSGTVKLDQVGTTVVECAIHPGMSLKVTVEP